MTMEKLNADARAYMELKKQADELKKEMDALKEAISRALNERNTDRVVFNDCTITYKIYTSETIDSKKLKEMFPDIAETCKKETISGRLTIK